MDKIIKKNNELLKEAVKSTKRIKKQLEEELIANYTDELSRKLELINKEIDKAEKLIDCTAQEGALLYAEFYPDRVDKYGEINSTGLKRLGFLQKKWGFTRFFKK